MGQPLWKTVWQFLKKKKVKLELPYDPAIPLIQNKQTNKDTNSKRRRHLSRSPALGVRRPSHWTTMEVSVWSCSI